MDRTRRKEAFEQLHRIEVAYGSVSELKEGHADLVRLRALFDGNLIANNTEESRIVARKTSGIGRGRPKKTAVYKDGELVGMYPSLKKASAKFKFPYSVVKREIKKGPYVRDGYKLVIVG